MQIDAVELDLADSLNGCRTNLPGWASEFSIAIRKLVNHMADKNLTEKNNLLYVDYIDWYSIFPSTKSIAIRAFGTVWWVKKSLSKEIHFPTILEGEVFSIPQNLPKRVWYEFNFVIANDFTKINSHITTESDSVEMLESYLAQVQKAKAELFGLSPFMLAVSEGNILEAKKLINSGIEIDAKDKGGNTALFLATLFHRLELIDLLMENNASTKLKNDDGVTPLEIALRKKDKYLIEKLSR